MLVFIVLVLGLLTTLYLYSTWTFSYWKKRGVVCDKPIPFFGNFAPNAFAKKSVTKILDELYWKYPNEKAVGFYRYTNPELLVRDPDIAKRVFSSDFQHFYARGLLATEADHMNLEILRRNLFVVEGDMWRLLKISMSPVLTGSKLRAMFPLIVERAERLQQRARSVSAGARPVDVRDLMARYTMDFIGACALGIDTDVQKKEDSIFRDLNKKIFEVTPRDAFADLLKLLFPSAFRNVKQLTRLEDEFCSLVKEILRQKNYKPSERHDFIDQMLEIQAKGKIECKSMVKVKSDGTPDQAFLEINDNVIAAQAFMFVGAGYETASSATSFTLYEIAYNPTVQKKVQDEIDRVLAKHNNKLSYDAIREMRYLEWTLKEGMRMVPPVGQLMRLCRRKTTFPKSDLTIEEGTRVLVSVQAMHHDPRYWDSPEEFRPERFSSESNEPRHPFAYLPFGFGPRVCLGERLGLMEAVTGLAAILSRFSVAPAPTSVRRPEMDPAVNLVQAVKGNLQLLFIPRTGT